MRTHSIDTVRLKQRAGDLAVILFLVLMFLATGCDAPGKEARANRDRGQAGGDVRSADVVTMTRAPVTTASFVTEEPVTPVETGPAVPENVTFEEAEALYRERRYHDAARFFAAYVERKPDNGWGHYMRGLSEWKAGLLEEAESSLRRAVELDPSHVKSRINLGRVLLQLDRPADAETEAESALELDPGSADGFRLLGLARDELGLEEYAVEAFRQAVILDDNDAWSANNLGLIYIRREWFVEALPPLARATELRDDVAVFQNNLGIALERSGYSTAASDAYRRALELDDGYEKARVNLARVEGRADEPNVSPLDLADEARRFVQEIRGEPLGSTEELDPSLRSVIADSTQSADSLVDDTTRSVPDSASGEKPLWRQLRDLQLGW